MALIIADNACQCSDPNCLSDSQICEASEPILTDDGSGHDISIPSVLLFKSDADNIKRYLYKRTNILMEISWSSKVIPGDRVECDLWFVPGDPISTNFLREFVPVAIAPGDRAYFTPHTFVFDGTLFGHLVVNNMNLICQTICVPITVGIVQYYQHFEDLLDRMSSARPYDYPVYGESLEK